MKKPPHKITKHLRARGERQRDPLREVVESGGLPRDATLDEKRAIVNKLMSKVLKNATTQED